MNPLAKNKGIAITLLPDRGLPGVLCDRDRIAQVFINLVDNAIKFTDSGGISITTGRDDKGIHVVVRDSGIGISREDITRLFVSFEQLGRQVDRRGGTGLGLAISKDIIEMHRGKMWVESESGKGSAFHFTLPLKVG